MHPDTLGTEAIRAFFTVQCCWLNNEEIYLEKGCLHCGSAATYLIYDPVRRYNLNQLFLCLCRREISFWCRHPVHSKAYPKKS